VKVYAVGPGVTAPELLPLNLAPFSAEKCKKKVDGKVVLSLLVDATGRPRNLMFLHPLGTDLDRFALQIVTADRFKPGTHDGAPVAIGQSVEVSMEACVEETEDNAGKKAYSLRLTAQPGQKLGALRQTPAVAVLTFGTWAWKEISDAASQTYHVGGSVTAPVPLNSVEAQYTPEARKARINGKCLISLTVDRQGMPQNVQVMRTLDPGLDQNAMDAVNRYRFKPAMRNGEPVPVKITVEVKFEIS
jgi:TonB family protein